MSCAKPDLRTDRGFAKPPETQAWVDDYSLVSQNRYRSGISRFRGKIQGQSKNPERPRRPVFMYCRLKLPANLSATLAHAFPTTQQTQKTTPGNSAGGTFSCDGETCDAVRQCTRSSAVCLNCRQSPPNPPRAPVGHRWDHSNNASSIGCQTVAASISELAVSAETPYTSVRAP